MLRDCASWEHVPRTRANESRYATPVLHAPITDPQKIICIGLNYRDHAEESGQDIPTAPMWFAKFANSLIGSGQEIVLPGAHAEYVDYEAELALVIGRSAECRRGGRARLHRRRDAVQRRERARGPGATEPLVDEREGDRHIRTAVLRRHAEEVEDLASLVLRNRIDGG